jgi:kynurenine 3-monooxygenase
MAPMVVVGGGMVGPVMAMYLARRFGDVDVLERRPPHSEPDHSLTVILSARGWRTLRDLGLSETVRDICLPLDGRTAHLATGETVFQPYSSRGEQIWCVERDLLHQRLSSAAAATPGVRCLYGVDVREVDPSSPSLVVDDGGGPRRVGYSLVVGCDGVHSVVRRSLGLPDAVERLAVGYQEINVSSSLDTTSFHYWPRGDTFFGAFPRARGGFNGSLFMRLDRTPPVLDFPDPPVTDVAAPVRTISTVRSSRWVWQDKVALLGDACHAMAPFMGHGMNCGFEDARVLDECFAEAGGCTEAALAKFERMRRPDADAISQISFEHYRNLVAPPPEDAPRQGWADWLFRSYPATFSSLYERCAFDDEMSYSQALSWHRTTERILDGLVESGSMTSRADSLHRAIANLPEDFRQPSLQDFPGHVEGATHVRSRVSF